MRENGICGALTSLSENNCEREIVTGSLKSMEYILQPQWISVHCFSLDQRSPDHPINIVILRAMLLACLKKDLSTTINHYLSAFPSVFLLFSGSSVVIFSVQSLSPSPACVCQSATSTRPNKQYLMWLSGHPPLLLHASCEQLDLQSDSRTGSPHSALIPPTLCICACDGARHVTSARFTASVSELISQQTTSRGCRCLFLVLRADQWS